MDSVAISWLVASATSPLIAVLALWTVYVFHTYRKRWRTVDLFLLAIASQELVAALFCFGYAIISLINPPIPALCSFIQWGMISIRTFQIATLTSMVVDRGLTVRWPYRYRFSVRRNQIRYHIAVLSLMAILVGVAAVFAHNQDGRSGVCSGHPSEWDFKFVLFLLGFYGVLLLVSFVCAVQIEVHKCRNGGGHEDKARPFQLSDSPGSDVPVPTSVTSPLDNESHTGSTKALHRPYRHSSRRPYGKKASGNSSDFRWPPVAVVSLVCFSVNHLPYLVLTSLAMAMPWLWSPWHESLLSWLRLAEGVLVPLILCLVDQPLRAALKRTFQRRSGALSPLVGDDGPFQMYFDKDHFRKRGTFGSVTPIGIITNYRRTPGKKRRNRKTKCKLPGLHSGDSVIEKSCLAGSFLSTEPLSKLSCADLTSLEVWQEEEEDNFYATLSDDFSNFSANSTDDNGVNEEVKMCDDVYGGSFTTIANDDFEFHDTRPCGGEVRMKPSMVVTVQPANSFRSSTKSTAFTKEKRKAEDKLKAPSLEHLNDLLNITLQLEEDKKAPDLFQTENNVFEPESNIVKTLEENSKSPASLSKATSFSLNDLDLIDSNDTAEKEKVFALPVKSESTMSLYRMRMDKNIENFLSAAKSDSNINADSGFCSGTQTMNPIWPGYPVRNVAAPLANHRKPVLSPGCVSNKNYPCILHPRMQRIPWISAWKKLGGSRESVEPNINRKTRDSDTMKYHDPAFRMLLINDNFELRQRDTFQWKDSIIYSRDDFKRHRQPDNQKPDVSDFNENTTKYPYGSSNYKDRHMKSDSFMNDVIKHPKNGTNNKKSTSCKTRKHSFRELPRKPSQESPYGRINDMKSTSKTLEKFNKSSHTAPEENIYEEIITPAKPQTVTDNKGKVKNQPPSADKSYAQTDILKLVNVIDNTYKPEDRDDFGNKASDFKLNINVNPTPSILEQNSFTYVDDFPITSELEPNDVSDLIINCVPLTNYDSELVHNEAMRLTDSRKEDRYRPESSFNNRLHVAYNVNASALEFIDKCEENNCMPTPYDNNVLGEEPDLNANPQQTYLDENNCETQDFKFHNHIDHSSMLKKETHRSRCRENNNKESKLLKGFIPDVVETSSYNKCEKYPVTRRERVNRDKSREVKRRESASRKKRESNIPRRESTKKPRCTSSYQECPQKRNEVPHVQKSESYNGNPWTKEHSSVPGNFNRIRDADYGRTCIQVEEPMTKDNCNFGEFERIRKGLHNSHDGEFHQANGVIRLHCNYQDHDRPKVENANRIFIHPEKGFDLSRSRNSDVNRIVVKNRSSDFPDRDSSQHRTDYVELYHRESGREKRSSARADRQKRHDVERKESDNRSRRKTSSSSRDRREEGLEKRDSLKEEAADRRRSRKTEVAVKTGNHVRRTNSFQSACETNANTTLSVNDVNRNESVKLNTEESLIDEHTRMDNLVYGRRENVNLMQEAEIFPFETFVKPLSYNNLMRNHVGIGAQSDYKDRCKQKKIAITDYL